MAMPRQREKKIVENGKGVKRTGLAPEGTGQLAYGRSVGAKRASEGRLLEMYLKHLKNRGMTHK